MTWTPWLIGLLAVVELGCSSSNEAGNGGSGANGNGANGNGANGSGASGNGANGRGAKSGGGGQTGTGGTIFISSGGGSDQSGGGGAGAPSVGADGGLDALRHSACAGAIARTEPLPSVLELVVDTSGSMKDR